MRIGVLNQKEQQMTRSIRRQIYALVRRMHVEYPSSNVDAMILQTMLNFCVTVLADNNVDREKAVEAFDRDLRMMQGEIDDE